MAAKPKPYAKSPSGMYAVRLSASHEHAGFLYKPSASAIIVDEAILEDMIAADVVAHVDPA